MNHPYETNHKAHTRHQQMIKSAANARRAKRMRQSQPRLDLFGKLRQLLSFPAARPVEPSTDPAVR